MCGHGFIFDGTNKQVRFAGKQLMKYEGFAENDVFVEFHCNRSDEHPSVGEHSFTDGGVRLVWTVSADTVWMAGAALEVTAAVQNPDKAHDTD